MRTRLTELLGIEHPVMLAGMGGVSYAELASAVSEAGGFGCLGAGTMNSATMEAEIAAVRQATDKPFAVDLLTAMPGSMEEQVQIIIDGGATAFVAALGVPTEVIEQCHRANVLVVNMCGKVDHAVRAVEAGCDLVVAQGTEAGGHTGQVATMPLVPQIVDAVGDRVPVVAAGGIFDGRGLAQRSPSAPTASGSAPASSPPLRPEASSATKIVCWPAARTRPLSAAPIPARRCGSCATRTRIISTIIPMS